MLKHVSKIPDEGNTTTVDDFCPCKLLPKSQDYFFYEGSRVPNTNEFMR